MRQIIAITLAYTVAALLTAIVAFTQAPPPPSLQEQLEAQYKLAKIGKGTSGLEVLVTGTVLVVQKAGILGVPLKSLATAPCVYMDGVLHPPTKKADIGAGILRGVSMPVSGVNSRAFVVGEKVYATKIDTNLKDDKVGIHIVECDACNAGITSSSYKSEVMFQFAKGYLAKASVPDVEDTIGQVFALGGPASIAQPAQPEPQVQPQPQPEQPAPAPAQPASIEKGQTIDQVVAILGQPEKRVDLGAKKIYVYKDLKITFVIGKVTDVQ